MDLLHLISGSIQMENQGLCCGRSRQECASGGRGPAQGTVRDFGHRSHWVECGQAHPDMLHRERPCKARLLDKLDSATLNFVERASAVWEEWAHHCFVRGVVLPLLVIMKPRGP